MTTLIVGGSGLIGNVLVTQLVRAGLRVRVTTRNSSGAVHASGVDWLQIPADRSLVPPEAFAGVSQTFLLAPGNWTNPFEFLGPWISAAKTAQVDNLVLMTACEPDDTDSSPYRRVETQFLDAGISGALLRPNWFMQNFHTYWREGIRNAAQIALPAGDARVSFIDTRDIADVAFALLTGARPDGTRILNLTGPEALTHHEVAEKLSVATQRQIRYRNISDQQLRADLVAAGLPAADADRIVAMFPTVRAGRVAPISGDLETLLGRKPRKFSDYAFDHRDFFR